MKGVLTLLTSCKQSWRQIERRFGYYGPYVFSKVLHDLTPNLSVINWEQGLNILGATNLWY